MSVAPDEHRAGTGDGFHEGNDMPANHPTDLARTTLQLLALAILVASSFWIARPFLISGTWAIAIAVATWPIFLGVQGWLGGSRSLAVALMTAVLLLILVVPLTLGVGAIVRNAPRVAALSESVTALVAPEPPAWLESVPAVGSAVAALWQEIRARGPESIRARLVPLAQMLIRRLVNRIGGFGMLILEFLLTIIITAILYANGELAADGAHRFARRLAGPQGENAVDLAAQAIRAVALGVVGTAIIQSALAGLGLLIVGVPLATLLTALTFVLCVAQLGPWFVLIPAAIWAYSTIGGVWGTGLLVWTIVCGLLDNVLRPVLIKRGADLPLLLIFAGVIGGLVAFGVIGLFIGPTVLAVVWRLLVQWVAAGTPSDDRMVPPAL